jgi:hypothetical protein
MVNVGVAVAVSAGSAAYASHQANKKAKQANSQAQGVRDAYGRVVQYAKMNPEAFGEKIDFSPVAYDPLFQKDPGYGKIAGDTIAGNQRNLGANLNLMRDTNQGITQDALTRINTIYPQFQGQFNQQSQNTANLLAGQIPQEDRNAMTARRTEAQSLGGGGVNQQQVAADLGLSRMQAMEAGAAGLTNNLNLWNSIDPLSRRVNPQSMFVDPQQAINSSIQENQFDATQAAAERDAAINYAMMPDPRKAGMMNLLAGQAGVQAATPMQGMQNVGAAALMAGATAGLGAWQQGQAAKSWNQNLDTTTPFVGTNYAAPVPTYATPIDQRAGYAALSGAGPVTGYGTQLSYGQGGLGSYYRGRNPAW